MGHPMGEIRVQLKGHNDPSKMVDLRGIGESLIGGGLCGSRRGGFVADSAKAVLWQRRLPAAWVWWRRIWWRRFFLWLNDFSILVGDFCGILSGGGLI